MRQTLIVAAFRLFALGMCTAVVTLIAMMLRPEFFSNGLPGVAVLGLLLGYIMASTGWLISTLWPVYRSFMSARHDRIVRKYLHE